MFARSLISSFALSLRAFTRFHDILSLLLFSCSSIVPFIRFWSRHSALHCSVSWSLTTQHIHTSFSIASTPSTRTSHIHETHHTPLNHSYLLHLVSGRIFCSRRWFLGSFVHLSSYTGLLYMFRSCSSSL
ncbi:hypothetical protein BC835DRAFT_907887 [Cytidiella melzeri]|nr:hypothetical protein BC835DRAFT_907887 [Cytidiella melzeri]